MKINNSIKRILEKDRNMLSNIEMDELYNYMYSN
jgi:hypothetical protein